MESSSRVSQLPTALLLTGVALCLLAAFEEYNPGGSVWAWIIVLLIVFGHLGLIGIGGQGFHRSAVARLSVLPFRLIAPVVVAFILVATAVLTWKHHEQIFRVPINPLDSAHMGVLVRATARYTAGEEPLYAHAYPRADGTVRNRFPVALKLPFATARAWGFDWRFASMAGVVLLGGALTLVGMWIAMTGATGARVYMSICLFVGSLWIISQPVVGMLHWGYWAPMWPLIAGLGLAISGGWWLAVAMLAGALAAMTPGWALLLPVVWAILWRERGKAAMPLLIPLLGLPLISYGMYRGEGESLLKGILGSFFSEGFSQARGESWRYPTFHAWGDFFGMRHAFYLFALMLLAAITREALKSETRLRRGELLAAASCVVIGFGPATYQYHWYAQAALLAGLLPLAAGCVAPRSWRPMVFGVIVTCAISTVTAGILMSSVPGALNRQPDGRQSHTEHLVAGFNVPSQDHAWGRAPHMVTGFLLDRQVGGILEIELGTLGGDFTPYNPAVIRVNGAPKGVFLCPPGRTRTAVIALSPMDVHVGFNIVEIEARWARSPRSYNVHDDDRPLSLSYKGLVYTPAGSR